MTISKELLGMLPKDDFKVLVEEGSHADGFVDGYNKALSEIRTILEKVELDQERLSEIINKEPLPSDGKKWGWAKEMAHAITYADGLLRRGE